jgi:hypothetical protein
MKRSDYAILAFLMVIILALVGVNAYQHANPPPQMTALGTTHFSAIETIGSITSGDDLTVTDDSTLAGWLTLTAETIIPVDAKPITPTATMVLTNGAGNTTNTIAACTTNGQLLYITNIATYTVTLADSGNWRLSAQLVLGQYDTAVLACVATGWTLLSTSNN